MPKCYRQEIRRTVLDLVNHGQIQIEVAQALGVSPKTLSHWVTTVQARMPDQQRNEVEELKRFRRLVRKQQAEIYFLKINMTPGSITLYEESGAPAHS